MLKMMGDVWGVQFCAGNRESVLIAVYVGLVLSTHPIQFPRSHVNHVNVFDGGIAKWAGLPQLQPTEQT